MDNLLFLDRGLVFNAGEYVEGFTSSAFTLLLIALRSTRLDYYSIVQGVALASAVSLGLGLIAINRKLSPPAAVRGSV